MTQCEAGWQAWDREFERDVAEGRLDKFEHGEPTEI
jgi:hypothetical protein